MDSTEFKKDFIESIKTAAAVTGEGSCASFVDNMAQYLIDAEALSDFTPSFYKGKSGRSNYRVDGYVYTKTALVRGWIPCKYHILHIGTI